MGGTDVYAWVVFHLGVWCPCLIRRIKGTNISTVIRTLIGPSITYNSYPTDRLIDKAA